MDKSFGIIAAVAVILLGIAFFIAVAARRRRAIESSGYARVATPDQSVVDLVAALFDATPAEAYRRDEPGGPTWLVFVDTGSSEGSGCVLIAYPAEPGDGPAAVLMRSGRRIPGFLRRLQGGLFKWTEPLDDAEAGGLSGTGWFAYKQRDRDIPPSLKDRLFGAVRLPQASALLGIAALDSHLAIWADDGKIKRLLTAAPRVRSAIQAPASET